MTPPPDSSAVVAVRATMTDDERRAALAALASGVRTVDLPAGWEVLHGEAVHASDPRPSKGTVTFECRAGNVHAVRRPSNTSRGGVANYFGPRSYEVSFEGSADPGTRTVRGTVSSQVKRYNRLVVPLAVVGGALIGWGLAVAENRLWLSAVLAPLFILLFLAWAFVTDRREAKILLADLQRMAAFSEGGRPAPGRIQHGKRQRS